MSTSLVCIDPEEERRHRIQLSAAPSIVETEEARIEGIQDAPDRLVKRYRTPTAAQREKIEAMLAAPPECPSLAEAPGVDEDEEPSFSQLAWPTAHVETDDGEWVGYAMPTLERDRCVRLHQLFSSEEREARELARSYRTRMATAYNLAQLVEALHAEDHYVIDLTPSRIRWDRESAFVALPGCDAFSVAPRSYGEDRFSGPKAPAGYTVPEVARGEEDLDEYGEEQDCFALAVVVFRLLNRGLHPYEGPSRDGEEGPSSTQERINAELYAYGREEHSTVKPAAGSLHPWFDSGTLRLFERAFDGDSIGEPPSASRWRRHLHAYVGRTPGRLQACSENDEHAQYPGQECGFCARAGDGEDARTNLRSETIRPEDEEETSADEKRESEAGEGNRQEIETGEDDEKDTDAGVGRDEDGGRRSDRADRENRDDNGAEFPGEEETETNDDEGDWASTGVGSAEADRGEQDAQEDNWAESLDEDWTETGPEPPSAPSGEAPGASSPDEDPADEGASRRTPSSSRPDARSPSERPEHTSSASSGSMEERTSTDAPDPTEAARQKTASGADSTTSRASGGRWATIGTAVGLGGLLLLYGIVNAFLFEDEAEPSAASPERTAGVPETDRSPQPREEKTDDEAANQSAATARDTTTDTPNTPDYDTLTVEDDVLKVRLNPRTGEAQVAVTSHSEFDQYHHVRMQRLREGDTTTVLYEEEMPYTVSLDSFRRGDRIRAVAHTEEYHARDDHVLTMDTAYTESVASFAENERTVQRTEPTVVDTSVVEETVREGRVLQLAFRHTDGPRTLIRASLADTTNRIRMALFYRGRDGTVDVLGIQRGPSPEVECFDLRAGDKMAVMAYQRRGDPIQVGLVYRGPDESARVLRTSTDLPSSARR